jgi:ATP-dependent Clp protease ATP-binding subunit ClpC
MEVLGNKILKKVDRPSKTPLLDEYGQNLVQMVADGDLDTGTERMVEGKALIRALSQPDQKSVLLVTDDDGAARLVVTRAAQSIVRKECPANLKNKRIVDVTAIDTEGKNMTETENRLQMLLAEAADAKDVILFLPAIKPLNATDRGDWWLDMLKTALNKKTVQYICQVTTQGYKWIEEDSAWRRLAQIIWIQEEEKDEIPDEL